MSSGKGYLNFILPNDLASDLLYIWLVVSTNLKNISQIGSFFQVGVNIKIVRNHHPDIAAINKKLSEWLNLRHL